MATEAGDMKLLGNFRKLIDMLALSSQVRRVTAFLTVITARDGNYDLVVVTSSQAW